MNKKIYLIFNKPNKVLSSIKKDNKYITVNDFISYLEEYKLHLIGRLDYNTRGALLITNDGILSNKLMHPKYKIPKMYLVKVKGIPSVHSLNTLRKGMKIPDGFTGVTGIKVIGITKQKNTWLQVILNIGKNRQIINMFWRIKTPPIKIIRTSFAGISIRDLKSGDFRELSSKEIFNLYRHVR